MPRKYLIVIFLFLIIGCEHKVSSTLPPFYWACAEGNTAKIIKYIKGGQDVNERSPIGRTALMYASGVLISSSERDYPAESAKNKMSENIDAIKTLIFYGADPNLSFGDETPLTWATYHGRLKTVKELLSAGANPNIGHPLSIAAYRCYPDVFKLLVEYGAKKDLIKREIFSSPRFCNINS